MTRSFKPLPSAISGACLLLPGTITLAHSGHGAPSVHAHTGSPAMLVVLGLAALGVAALVPLMRLMLRRRRVRRQTQTRA